jgi:hypothetical protein
MDSLPQALRRDFARTMNQNLFSKAYPLPLHPRCLHEPFSVPVTQLTWQLPPPHG